VNQALEVGRTARSIEDIPKNEGAKAEADAIRDARRIVDFTMVKCIIYVTIKASCRLQRARVSRVGFVPSSQLKRYLRY